MLKTLMVAAALASLPLRPDPSLTPGVTTHVTLADICTPGYAGKHRAVSEKTKKAVFADYGIKPSGLFEIDHLISLELGGSNDIRNLWPQSYHTKSNAHMKDALENRLHWLVCHRKLSLGDAQHEISTDWIAAYDKYIANGPTKGTK